VALERLPDYIALRKDVVEALEEGQEKARKAVEDVRVQTYWNIGTRLCAFLDANEGDYGDQIVQHLSRDVGVDYRRLYEIVKFRRLIESFHPGGILTWSHYRRLIRIGDSSIRTRFLAAAVDHKWSVRQLEEQIADGALLTALPPPDSPSEFTDEASRLVAKRGEPWVYRVVEKSGFGRALDLGFRVYERLSDHDDPGFEDGTLVQAEKTNDRYRILPFERRRRVFSYRATISSIIDADTFWISIDCGFGTVCDQKVRLRGIDCPELKTAAGTLARDFVVEALKEVDHIVVSTTKLDLYDRYLSDVFYLPGESDPLRVAQNGRYLNRELIDTGHARQWTDAPAGW
jgi:endonuclease YncB( thermonuclease family)